MNPNTLARLVWQIPALVFLVVMMTPWLSVNSTFIGPWLIWLLASPALLLTFNWRRMTSSSSPYHPESGAQVLAFSAANRCQPVAMPIQRRAA